MAPLTQHLLHLEPIQADEQDSVVALIAAAMNADEARWANQTLSFYFECQAAGIDAYRRIYIVRKEADLLGVVGLHEYRWGPPENVWLSWFAVHPRHQGQGLGRGLLQTIEVRARELGYRKMFIETYEHADFARAIGFYRHLGFTDAGQIGGYLPDNSAMLVLSKLL